MSEREKFLGEGYVPTKIFNEHGFALLLPRETVEAIEKAQVAARLAERKVMEEKKRLESQGENEAEAETTALSGADSGSMRKVFDLQAISEVLAVRGKGDRERSEQLKDWAKLMRKSGGCRAVRRFPARLDDLREQFPNFSRVIDAVEALVAVGAADEQGVAVEPLLMVGPPGVGKTLFVEALADAAGVEMSAIPLGAAQGGFEIVGTSTHWSNTTPGQVWKLLAMGGSANAVLLLDEIDKMYGDTRFSTESSLLDLLEPRTAARFEDQAVDVAMDASLLWKLATANTLDTLSAPIKSRFEIVEIKPPTTSELVEIYRRQWDRHCEGHKNAPDLSSGVLATMAKDRISPREASRRLRFTLGAAMRDGLSRVDALFEVAAGSKRGARIGFVLE